MAIFVNTSNVKYLNGFISDIIFGVKFCLENKIILLNIIYASAIKDNNAYRLTCASNNTKLKYQYFDIEIIICGNELLPLMLLLKIKTK